MDWILELRQGVVDSSCYLHDAVIDAVIAAVIYIMLSCCDAVIGVNLHHAVDAAAAADTVENICNYVFLRI